MVGGPGLQRGGSVVNILQIGEGQSCFVRNRGRIAVFFGKEKITPCRLVDPYLLTNTRSVWKSSVLESTFARIYLF